MEAAREVDGGLPGLTGPCLGVGRRDEMPCWDKPSRIDGRTFASWGRDPRGNTASAADSATATGVAVLHAVDASGRLLDRLGVPGLPVTLAVDPEGRIIARQIGQLRPAELASSCKRWRLAVLSLAVEHLTPQGRSAAPDRSLLPATVRSGFGMDAACASGPR